MRFLALGCAIFGTTGAWAKMESNLDLPMFTRQNLNIVATKVAKEFTQDTIDRLYRDGTLRRNPQVEYLGNGNAIDKFCRNVGEKYPDIMVLSRALKPDERDKCAGNSVLRLWKAYLGNRHIHIAQGSNMTEAVDGTMNLTVRDLYMALAEKVPSRKDKRLIKNPYKYWNQINKKLPKLPIKIYGPPKSSPAYLTMRELIMTQGSDWSQALRNLKVYKPIEYKRAIQRLRSDEIYQEIPYDRQYFNITEFTLDQPDAVFVMNTRKYARKGSALIYANLNGVASMPERLEDKTYPHLPMYIYFKGRHVLSHVDMLTLMQHLISQNYWVNQRILIARGLSGPTEKQQAEMKRDLVPNITSYIEEVSRRRMVQLRIMMKSQDEEMCKDLEYMKRSGWHLLLDDYDDPDKCIRIWQARDKQKVTRDKMLQEQSDRSGLALDDLTDELRSTLLEAALDFEKEQEQKKKEEESNKFASPAIKAILTGEFFDLEGFPYDTKSPLEDKYAEDANKN